MCICRSNEEGWQKVHYSYSPQVERWLWFYTFCTISRVKNIYSLWVLEQYQHRNERSVVCETCMYFDKSTVSFPAYVTGIVTHLPTSSLPISANIYGKSNISMWDNTFRGETQLSGAKGRGLEEKGQQRKCWGECPTTELGTHSHTAKKQEAENQGRIKSGTRWLSTT